MAAVAERAIHGDFACSRSENFHDLANHDRTMRARGRLAAGDDLGDVAGITFRRVLFILLGKVSRVLSAVSRPPLGFFRTHVRVRNYFVCAGSLSLQISTMQIESTTRFGGGTGMPRSVIILRIIEAVSARLTADWTPTRTRPS